MKTKKERDMLKGKVAIITGAARGIGKAIAMEFAKNGATVYLFDLKGAEDTAEALSKEGLKACGVSVNITDPDAVHAAVDHIIKKEGKVDILVNNAGIIARDAFVDLSYKTWTSVMDVNVNGNYNLCKAVVPGMIERRYGKILNISSIAGKMGDLTAAACYGTSKGAINAFTKSLARQLAPYGINSNAIAPHAIETDMSAQWSAEKRASVIAGIPLQKMGTPEDVAKASLFLVSDDASFITGEVLNLNGGALMD